MLNSFRFINVILPTIFAFIVGIGFLIFGIRLMFLDSDFKSGIAVLCISGIFIVLGFIFKSIIPNKFKEK
jgi:hypothetical protein